jgi:alpha-L-fucosidase
MNHNLMNFGELRYGLFIHYGLYSLLGRGEWAWNREEIPAADYGALADRFTAEKFDANELCDLAVRAGMRYVVLTTMHHEGFRLYDTALSDFNTKKTASRRDLVAELVVAARKRGLRIGLYHSLNNWHDQPDPVVALEDKAAYAKFIDATFARIRELVTKFNPIDVLWYDGWWPFNAEGWQAERMNAMVREIQPQILFNGRNGLPGDFATPEGHMGAPQPWRPWEACMTLNNSWGFHAGDNEWKTPGQVVDLLTSAAQGRGNLLLNIGPRGDGSVPKESVKVLETVGGWLRRSGDEAIYGSELFTFDLQERGQHRGDWSFHGPFTVKENNLYWLIRRWSGGELTLGGLQAKVRCVQLLGEAGRAVSFRQEGTKVILSGLPDMPPDPLCPVFRIECDRPPSLYQCGGLRIPKVSHPHYDPCPSDIKH